MISCDNIKPLPPLDGKGLSGHYAGVVDGRLLVAGGCNFPDKALTDGGAKKFYDEILALEDGVWTVVGHLPEPSAYAIYAAIDSGLLVMGGANASGPKDNVWLITDGGSKVKTLPSLPKPLEQAAAINYNGTIYLAGGLSAGAPSQEVFAFDGESWKTMGTLPRPVVQGIATARGEEITIWGGFDPLTCEALTEGFVLNFSTGEWSEGPKTEVTFVGSSCLDGYAAGGCDKEVFTNAIRLPQEKIREYQLQPVEYYKFRGEVLALDGPTQKWRSVAQYPAFARAGAAIASYNGGYAIIGGELKPGIRATEATFIKF